jgi:hypothetical protein
MSLLPSQSTPQTLARLSARLQYYLAVSRSRKTVIEPGPDNKVRGSAAIERSPAAHRPCEARHAEAFEEHAEAFKEEDLPNIMKYPR